MARTLARLAYVLGRHKQAIAHDEQAMPTANASGCNRNSRRSVEDGERRRARELSGQALETVQRLGMKPLASSSERLLRTLSARSRIVHRNP